MSSKKNIVITNDINDENWQQQCLKTALNVVKQQAFGMTRSIDADNMDIDPANLQSVLDYATEMLRELRSNVLTPKNYYELYMAVVEELRVLEDYFRYLQRNGMAMVKLYEQVQSVGNVVPRLYLLCCVGSVYIVSKEAPVKDILRDLVEMLKGVQHPIRGLFLRNYLTQISKNKLPDVGSIYEGEGGTVEDAYRFVLQNFAEANRLWVRLQSQGAGNKNKKKREAERHDIRVLVGLNLVTLSQLEGLHLDKYKEDVLPKILEEIVNCKDTMAQTYLMDCIIQVFPDDFHFGTLQSFLDTCASLKEKVNVRTILESLMERLGTHVSDGGDLPGEVDTFRLFNDCITRIIEERANMPLVESLKLQTSLLDFALKCYPTRMDYVSHCLETCAGIIDKTDFSQQKTSTTEEDRVTDDVTLQIESLLQAPLDSLALRVLEIPPYSKLMSYLPWGNWKEVAVTLVNVVTLRNTILDNVEQVEQLFNAVRPLLQDPDGFIPKLDSNEVELPPSQKFIDEQLLLAKCVHLMYVEDTDLLLRIFVTVRKYFQDGGINRIKYTMPALVINALKLAQQVKKREMQVEIDGENAVAPQYDCKKVFQFVMDIASKIGSANHPEQALKLFLLASQCADSCDMPLIAYELFSEAAILYENEIVEEKIKVRTLGDMIGTLMTCKNFSTEDYDNITTKLCQYSAKLLKKPDQCKMITLCSHLFCPPLCSDGTNRLESMGFSGDEYLAVNKKSLECMKKAINVIRPAPILALFIEILNRSIYHYEQNNKYFDGQFISALIALINNHLGSDSTARRDPDVEEFYRNTLGNS